MSWYDIAHGISLKGGWQWIITLEKKNDITYGKNGSLRSDWLFDRHNNTYNDNDLEINQAGI